MKQPIYILIIIALTLFGCQSRHTDQQQLITKRFNTSDFDTTIYITDTIQMAGWLFFYPDVAEPSPLVEPGIPPPCIPLFLDSSNMIDSVNYDSISMSDLLRQGASYLIMPDDFLIMNGYNNDNFYNKNKEKYTLCSEHYRMDFDPHVFISHYFKYNGDKPSAIYKGFSANFVSFFVHYYKLAQNRTFIFYSLIPEGYIKCITPVCE